MNKIKKIMSSIGFLCLVIICTNVNSNLFAEKLMTDSSYKNVRTTNNGEKYVLNANIEQLKLPFADKLLVHRQELSQRDKVIWDYLYKTLINFNGTSTNNFNYVKDPNKANGYYKLDLKDMGVKAKFEDVDRILRLLISDDPRFYFIDSYPIVNNQLNPNNLEAKDLDSDGNARSYKVVTDTTFNKPGVYENSLSVIEKSVTSLLSQIKPWMNQRQISVLLTTKLHALVTYKLDGVDKFNDEYDNRHSMNSTFGPHHFGVCESFSKALQYLLLRTGVHVMWTGGLWNYFSGVHAWDLVEFSGKWYMMDPTWGWTIKGADDSYVQKRTYSFNDVFYIGHPQLANTPSSDYIFLPNEKDYKKYVANSNNVEVQVNGIKQTSTTKTFDQSINLGTFDNVDLSNVKFNLNQDEYVSVSGVKSINNYNIDQIESKQKTDGTFIINIKTKFVKPSVAQKVIPRRLPNLKLYAKFGKHQNRLININIDLNKTFKLPKNSLRLNRTLVKVVSKKVHGKIRYYLVGLKTNKHYKIRKVNVSVSKNNDKIFHIYVYKK